MRPLTREGVVELLNEPAIETGAQDYIEDLFHRASRAGQGRFYELYLSPRIELFDVCWYDYFPRRRRDRHNQLLCTVKSFEPWEGWEELLPEWVERLWKEIVGNFTDEIHRPEWRRNARLSVTVIGPRLIGVCEEVEGGDI